MRNLTKTAVVVVSAFAAVLLVAVAAFAGTATLQGTLTVSPSGGHFGDELTIAPSMNTTGYPGDVVDIQYLADDNTWQKYGESLSLEDTTDPDPVSGRTTIGPLAFIVDDSLTYPAVLRAVFMPKNSAEGTCASDPVWLRVYQYTHTTVNMSGPSKASPGRHYTITGTVSPLSGVGTVRVTLRKLVKGAPTLRYDILTDDEGVALYTFARPKGRYLVTERFLGNQFGAASGVASKIIVVKATGSKKGVTKLGSK